MPSVVKSWLQFYVIFDCYTDPRKVISENGECIKLPPSVGRWQACIEFQTTKETPYWCCAVRRKKTENLRSKEGLATHIWRLRKYLHSSYSLLLLQRLKSFSYLLSKRKLLSKSTSNFQAE